MSVEMPENSPSEDLNLEEESTLEAVIRNVKKKEAKRLSELGYSEQEAEEMQEKMEQLRSEREKAVDKALAGRKGEDFDTDDFRDKWKEVEEIDKQQKELGEKFWSKPER